MNKKYTYNYSKSTKNTHVYTNEQLGVYYLPKTVIGDTAPEQIDVTLATHV